MSVSLHLRSWYIFRSNLPNASGLGLATARNVIDAGANVSILDTNPDVGEAVVKLLSSSHA